MAAAAILPLLLGAPLLGQTGATLLPGGLAHRDMDVLIGHGVVTSAVVGQRPWSWREVARALEDAAVGLDALRQVGDEPERLAYLEGVADRLRRRLELRESATVAFEDAFLDVGWLRSPRHGFPDNGLGRIDADLNPLVQYRQGRRFADGTTASVEAGATAAATRWLTLQVRPRLAVSSSNLAPAGMEEERSDLSLQRASARLILRNLAVVVGREPVFWGPGPQSGMLISRNARPLDVVHFSGDTPFRFPGPFARLGPTRASFFAADLGEDRDFPGALLFGGKLSVLPHPNVEVGFAFLNLQGGEGAPEASLKDRIFDILILPDLLRSEEDFLFSEKIGGGDLRVRIPRLRGLELYLEGVLTDFDVGRAQQTFWKEAAYQAGVALRLGARGASTLRLEGYHTGVRFYRHHQFRSGLTLDRMLIGNGLGPDGNGALLEWTWEGPALLALRGAWEDRSADGYVIMNEPFEHNIVLDEDRPNERRWRLSAIGQRLGAFPAFYAEAEVGIERVESFGYALGRDRANALARIQVGWRR